MQRALPRAFTLTFVLSLLALSASAQYFRQSSYWKTHRKEVEFGFGMANFLGELGGRNQIGSPFLWDFEISQTRPAVHLAYRYYLARQQALRGRLTYGILAGNDNTTTEMFRQNRNLSFKSDVFEFSLVYELHLYREELGHMYDLRGVKGTKSSRFGLYFFLGVGGFYFDPRAQFNNSWVRLKPLSTEGQGLPGGAEEYNNFQFCIPMGFGIRRAFTKNWSGGLEVQYTKTFTDYIDDVSTNYYDNEVLLQERGEVAAYLADPSLGTNPELASQTNTGEQRGDEKDLDAYLFLKFTADYKLYRYKSGSKKYRARIRRAKIVF
ncbi:MAG: outer membrane beta-barrel protein [Flavobacteriales bacterium]|jgi:hypothetical protein|nr:outer membrane beta-barrel protein [Flavobacteriales bacterium]